MERTLDTRVNQAIEVWLLWVPSWKPATHRGRTRLCDRCFGSPLIRSAGLVSDVPHAIQHGLTTRLTAVIDETIAVYTSQNLPLLDNYLAEDERRRRFRYHPDKGLPPELVGAPLDPEPAAGHPFLFTLAGLADEERVTQQGQLPRIDGEVAEQLQREMALADDYAQTVGRNVCKLLTNRRFEIVECVNRHVEPQIAALLRDLDASLETPPGTW